jgi:hypothetical protein
MNHVNCYLIEILEFLRRRGMPDKYYFQCKADLEKAA